MSLRIAVVYIAEAYQCYHGAAVALELAAREDVEVVNFYVDPATPRHLERIRAAFGGPAIDGRPLRRSLITRGLQKLTALGAFKEMILHDNRALLDSFDAIFAVENTIALARDVGVARPRLIYSPHGFGDRAYAFVDRIDALDFVMLAGPKTEQRMLDAKLIRPRAYALTGSIKLETAARLDAAAPPLFPDGRPTVLYNPHFDLKLRSWDRFIGPMIDTFAAQDDFDLIAAPHVKLFRHASRAERDRWETRSSPRVVIDTGSDRSIDASYLAAAAIYVGDSSSQVYEFLARPRPCVFVNAHQVDWRDDPNYAHWHLGDVVDCPDALLPTIAAATDRHGLYRDRQERLAAASLGDRSPGAARRAADAILAFMASAGLAARSLAPPAPTTAYR